MRSKLCKNCDEARTVCTGSQIFYLCPVNGAYRSPADECTTQKQFLENIQKPQPTPSIQQEELEWAKKYVETFRCPHKRSPLNCDGKKCGVDEYYDCLEWLKANALISSVLCGEIQIVGKSHPKGFLELSQLEKIGVSTALLRAVRRKLEE